MTGPSRAELQAHVKHAFRNVPGLPAEAIVLEQYRHNIDAQEMASALGGRHWTELSLEELFFHRESIFMFSSAAGHHAGTVPWVYPARSRHALPHFCQACRRAGWYRPADCTTTS